MSCRFMPATTLQINQSRAAGSNERAQKSTKTKGSPVPINTLILTYSGPARGVKNKKHDRLR